MSACVWQRCVLFWSIVEDQKEVPSAVNPELRHKEVQMNFFNQLTSVFNPDLTTILASPSAAQLQARNAEQPADFLFHWPTRLCSDSITGMNLSCFLPTSCRVVAQLMSPDDRRSCRLSFCRLRVIAMTKPQIKPSRPKWKMPLSLRMCQAYRS